MGLLVDTSHSQNETIRPLTPAVGDLVATNRGYRPLSLEGFSEDVNEDGFVDPIAPAVAAAPVVAAPAVAAVKTVEVKAAPVAAVAYAAPAVHVATAPVVHHVGYQVHHQVHHIPKVTVQKHTSTHTTHHVINHAPVIGAFSGVVPVAGVPVVAAAPAEADAADAAPVVEEA